MKSQHTNEYIKLISLLIEARKSAGVTQAGLAKELKKPQSYVSKFENRERRLDIVEFLEICKVLKVSYQELIEAVF